MTPVDKTMDPLPTSHWSSKPFVMQTIFSPRFLNVISWQLAKAVQSSCLEIAPFCVTSPNGLQPFKPFFRPISSWITFQVVRHSGEQRRRRTAGNKSTYLRKSQPSAPSKYHRKAVCWLLSRCNIACSMVLASGLEYTKYAPNLSDWRLGNQQVRATVKTNL